MLMVVLLSHYNNISVEILQILFIGSNTHDSFPPINLQKDSVTMYNSGSLKSLHF